MGAGRVLGAAELRRFWSLKTIAVQTEGADGLRILAFLRAIEPPLVRQSGACYKNIGSRHGYLQALGAYPPAFFYLRIIGPLLILRGLCISNRAMKKARERIPWLCEQLEPAIGLEPMTPALRERCSTN